MKRRLAFSLFDSGETVLSALVFSTFFPLYITKHIDTKVYSSLYGLSFLLSFGLALYLGKIADRRAVRKHLFVTFSLLVPLLCVGIGILFQFPLISLLAFLALAVTHQQAFVFYNSLLLGFDSRGITSGMGVAFGYLGSALALLFLARYLKEPEVYFVVGGVFLLLSLPAFLYLQNPEVRSEVSIAGVLRDRRFLLLILTILTLTEVANTLIAMMGVYLREVYGFVREEIYRVIGLSALGGIFGGFLWGYLTDRVGVRRVFPLGFLIWFLFLVSLPHAPAGMVVFVGLLAGMSLAHIWTTSRILILSEFPEGEASVRLSFLSLTERIASTTGLLMWAFFLLITDNNFRVSAGLMSVFPLVGLVLFLLYVKTGEENSFGS